MDGWMSKFIIFRQEPHQPWFSCISSILLELKFGVLVFVDKGKRDRQRKTLEQGATQPMHGTGRVRTEIETGLHWWEAIALTTASSLLPISGNIKNPVKLFACLLYLKEVGSFEQPAPQNQ